MTQVAPAPKRKAEGAVKKALKRARDTAWRSLPRVIGIVIAVAVLIEATRLIHDFIASQSNDTSWSPAIQATTSLLLVAITAWYVVLTAGLLRVQQAQLDRSSEEPRVRGLKETLDKGANYGNHFQQLQRWLPIRPEDLIDDRALTEFQTDDWDLDDLERTLSIAAPQLPQDIRARCQYLTSLIKDARHDLAWLFEAAEKEKLAAVNENRPATWDMARKQFAGAEQPWLELLRGQAALGLGPTYEELDRVLQSRIDRYSPSF